MDIKPFKPLLASDATASLDKLVYPVLASPKYDGVRAIVRGHTLMSRNMKPIKNSMLQKLLGRPEFEGLDGELIFGDPTAPDVFQKSQSGTKLEGGVEDAIFFPFDCINHPDQPFTIRFEEVKRMLGAERIMYQGLGISRPKHVLVNTPKELTDLEDLVLKQGFEGLMLRDPDGVYKFGRSTVNEGILLKVKRWEYDEAEVMGAYEQMENTNFATIGELGQTKRSHHKAGMVGKQTLGGFKVKMLNGIFLGKTVDVGTGWTDAERAALWSDWHRLGQKKFTHEMGYLRIKHQKVGSKDKPRFPIASGWRSPGDMS